MNKGVLVAFEGIDGTGKSTQLQLLADHLQGTGCPVLVTREPTDGTFGQKIRRLYIDRSSSTPEEELDFFIQDRKEHVAECLLPALQKGTIVLTDRYYYSTAAYQGAVGMNIKEIFTRNGFAPRPDIVILLTMDPEVSISRIEKGRKETCNDFEQLEQLRRVAENFASFSDDCICRINANQPVKQVQTEIQQAVLRTLETVNYSCT
jgi:dTMP kinase